MVWMPRLGNRLCTRPYCRVHLSTPVCSVTALALVGCSFSSISSPFPSSSSSYTFSFRFSTSPFLLFFLLFRFFLPLLYLPLLLFLLLCLLHLIFLRLSFFFLVLLPVLSSPPPFHPFHLLVVIALIVDGSFFFVFLFRLQRCRCQLRYCEKLNHALVLFVQ